MKNKQRSRRAPRIGPGQHSQNEESRTADAVTVAWLLCGLVTLAAQVVVALALAVHARWSDDRAQMVTAVFQFVAMISGALTLIVTPLALRARQQPPPVAITWGALTLGIMPWAAWAVARWWSG